MLLWVLLGADAEAGFGARTSRDPLPAREIGRPVVLPKGWTELALSAARQRVLGAWGTDGARLDLPAPEGAAARDWRSWTATASIRHGVMPGVELFGGLPAHLNRRDDLRDRGFGTAEVGGRVALGQREPPARSSAVEVGARVPVGSEGAPLDPDDPVLSPALPLTTGTWDAWVGLIGRRQVEGVLLEGHVQATRRFGGVVSWIDTGTADGWAKPGDQVRLRGLAMLQAGPLGFGVEPSASAHGPLRLEREPVDGSAGFRADLGLKVLAQVSRGFDLGVDWRLPLAGQDSAWLGIEEVHPARSRAVRFTTRGRW